jgi:hypothetical protein
MCSFVGQYDKIEGVAEHIFWFAQLRRSTQQVIMMEKIKGTRVAWTILQEKNWCVPSQTISVG